jgi:hypothetical protein
MGGAFVESSEPPCVVGPHACATRPTWKETVPGFARA